MSVAEKLRHLQQGEANTTSSVVKQPADLFYLHPPVNYILAAMFGFLIIFCVTGNLLVLIILTRFRRMRTRTNMLLANLSAIDLLTGRYGMPVVESLEKHIYCKSTINYGGNMNESH